MATEYDYTNGQIYADGYHVYLAPDGKVVDELYQAKKDGERVIGIEYTEQAQASELWFVEHHIMRSTVSFEYGTEWDEPYDEAKPAVFTYRLEGDERLVKELAGKIEKMAAELCSAEFAKGSSDRKARWHQLLKDDTNKALNPSPRPGWSNNRRAP